jgi:hypothetical protein
MSDAGSRDGPRGRWPWGFLGMLALVLAVEAGLSGAERDLAPLSAADWGRVRRAASDEATRADVLCFGDSLVKFGVVPAVIEAKLGRAAYNLAALAAPPPTTYFLLRRALEAGARPSAIIVDAKASPMVAATYRANVRDWAVLAEPRDALELAAADHDLGFFGLYLVHRFLPSARLRLDVRKTVLDRLNGRPPASEVPWQPLIDRQYAINRGAILKAPNHSKDGPDPYPGGALVWEGAICYPPSWSPYPTNLAYLHKFCTLAASRSIPVFFVIPPIHPGVQAVREQLGLDAAYIAILREIRDMHANVVIVDGRHAGYGHGVYVDARHLNYEGATALSEALADVIGHRLAGEAASDRWVPLPSFVEPRAQLAIENIDASKHVIRQTIMR